MTGDDLPGDSHVVHYVKPECVEDAYPAFSS